MANKKAASEETLGTVHELLARRAIDILTATTEVEDLKTGEKKLVPMLPSAADMSWIRAFLKDNEITCAADGDNAVSELRKELDKQRREREHGLRPKPAAGSPFDPAQDLPDGMPMQ